MQKSFQIRGDKNNPFHLSVGGILVKNDSIYLIQKPDGYLTLPRETVYLDESLDSALIRGFKEELGVIVKVENFLGTLITRFNRSDGSEI